MVGKMALDKVGKSEQRSFKIIDETKVVANLIRANKCWLLVHRMYILECAYKFLNGGNKQ